MALLRREQHGEAMLGYKREAHQKALQLDVPTPAPPSTVQRPFCLNRGRLG